MYADGGLQDATQPEATLLICWLRCVAVLCPIASASCTQHKARSAPTHCSAMCKPETWLYQVFLPSTGMPVAAIMALSKWSRPELLSLS
jgi:hypothetical protein